MTHTLYREGNIDSLKNDYVVVITGATGYNKKGCAQKLRGSLVRKAYQVGREFH